MSRPSIDKLRNRHLLVLDTALAAFVPILLYLLRYEGLQWPDGQLKTVVTFTILSLPVQLAIYFAFGMYKQLWRFAGIAELELVFLAGFAAAIASFVIGRFVDPAFGLAPQRMGLSILFNYGILNLVVLATPRVFLRLGRIPLVDLGVNQRPTGRRVVIVGAGVAGRMILREMRQNPELSVQPIGFLDDAPEKQGKNVAGLRVLGPLSSLGSIAQRHKVDELVIAMPSAPGGVIRQIVRAALDAHIPARTIPSLGELLSGQLEVGRLREIRIEDLLRRESITTNMEQVRTLAANRTVLVTGAGGSIGSELARQIARLQPARLLLLGHGENPIFHILGELRTAHPQLDLVPIIADVRDRRRMFQVIERYQPSTVFHAAAHKHVPLMEDNVIEAVTNNVKGTQNVVDAASANDVEHFVMISTDKAVHPTSVMGASKRVAEHVVRGAALRHRKNFVAVRFGNVLGSQGSVVPIFMQQIRRGGPVTVTHPDMRRYFMTIPEAVQLVLQAGAIGRGGELFMLDMGEPVKIVDLASDLIRLSGLEVGDIEIRFTGARPGEKLCEEMFFDHEETTQTEHPKVLCAKDVLKPGDSERIDRLVQATMDGVTEDELRMMIRAIVPDYVWEPSIVTLPLGAAPYPQTAERENARSGSATSRPVRAAS
jgi:FlaA1/EpsC-like NDP-sugar epimerase